MGVPEPRPPDGGVTRIRRDQLQVILDVTRRIVGTLDLEQLLSTLLDSLVSTFKVERALVMLSDGPEGELAVRVTRNLRGTQLDEAVDYSRRVVQTVRESGQPLIAADAHDQSALREFSSLDEKGIRGLVCYPLLRDRKILGVVYLDSRGSMNLLTPTAVTFLATLCNLAAIAIENARSHQAVVAENRDLKGEIRRRDAIDGVVGSSPAMRSLLLRAEGAAALPVTVLLLGESGTGKELIARAIHAKSPRAEHRFVAVNCGELPDTLVEGELFGYKKGAFTGALADRKGLFEEADGGTLFLDEITNTSPGLQAKLLRAIQEGEARRVGENVPRKVDVRLVCATNCDLADLVREGKFREDLFYRINVVSLRLPALRDRPEDVPLLADHFVRKYNAKFGRAFKGLSPEAMDLALRYPWPGNVRELENAVQRAMAQGQGETLGPRDLGVRVAPGRPASDRTYREEVQEFERSLIRRALESSGGNIAQAAESLGMARQQLHRMVQKYGVPTEPLPPDTTDGGDA